MKKYAIAIICLVLAAFVFGACETNSGGTIKVTNASKTLSVDVYVTRSSSSGDTTPPTSGLVVMKNIEPDTTEEIKISEDGTYYVKPFFLTKNGEGNVTEEVLGKAEPNSGMVYLMGGDTETVTVTQKKP